MQVLDMRALRSLYYQKHSFNLCAHRFNSRPSFISSEYSQNPEISRYFRQACRRTIHSTNQRRGKESSVDVDSSNGYTSPLWANETSPRSEKTPGVYTVYDPVSSSIVTKRGTKNNNGEQELERSDSGENSPTLLSLDFQDDSEDRVYGRVRKANSLDGSRHILGSKKKGKSKTVWVCTNCGNTDGQWWGICHACNSGGTMKAFNEGESDGGKTSGFQVSENVLRSWLPQQSDQATPLRLTDVKRGINQLNWRIPL